MARTNLLNTLQSWAREIEAQEAAVSNATVLVESGLSRRRFIGGLGAAGLLAVLPKWTKAAEQPRIAIIGAGIAGLSCALGLRDHGVAADIFEASHRVGGRMFSLSDYWNDGQVSEWCGELIDTGHRTVIKLAQRFGLPLDDLLAAQPEGSEETYYLSGYYSYENAKADFAEAYKIIKEDLLAAGYPTRYDSYTAAGQALDNMSIYDWIGSRIPGGHGSNFGKLLDVAYNIEYGAETIDQSALNLLYLLAYQENSSSKAKKLNVFGVSDERYHIHGGNQRLPEKIADYLGDIITFSMRLISIARLADQRYRLRFENTVTNAEFEDVYDYVVLAIPFAVLREIDYADAGFDALKDMAIQELGRGRSGKLQLQFANRYWNQISIDGVTPNGSTYSDTGYQSSWEVSRGQAGDSGILNLYSGGDTTAAMVTTQPFATVINPSVLIDADNGLAQVSPVFSGISGAWNGKATQSLPHRSDFFKASYAYYRVGQYTAFGGYEGAPQGNVLFCGEHTSQDFQGYMEGGASEGERAAKMLLKAVR